MQNNHELKPNKWAFVEYRFFVRFIYLGIFFVLLNTILNRFIETSKAYILVAFAVPLIYNYISLSVQYKKERYTFLPGKIIRNGGSIFSDYEVELIIKNITQVSSVMPFIKRILFKTGNISIQSAGSGGVEVQLSSLDNPQKIYGHIEQVMKRNGFKLKKSKLVQEEHPSSMGIALESLFATSVVAFPIIVIFLPLQELWEAIFNFLGNVIIPIIVIILWFALSIIMSFIDLRKRTYYLYTDTMSYSGGFFSKTSAFIPLENLSDSEVKQGVIDRMLGLYDITLSCQGAGTDIRFGNIINGNVMKDNISKLIARSKTIVTAEKKERGSMQKKAAAHSPAEYKTRTLPTDKKFTAEYKPHIGNLITTMVMLFLAALVASPLAGLLFGLLVSLFHGPSAILSGFVMGTGGMLLFIFFVGGPIFIITLLYMSRTRFVVKKRSIVQKLDFVIKKDIEFSDEKIMAVVFSESFIDKLFNTCSIGFFSIGGRKAITFFSIKKSSGLYDSILKKEGYASEEKNALHRMESDFSIMRMVKANLPTIMVFMLIIGGLVAATMFLHPTYVLFIIFLVAACILVVIYKHFYYKRSKMAFYKHFVHFTQGIITKQYWYAAYDNIRDITTVKYPLSDFGSVRFDIAGEQIIETREGTKKFSNGFTIPYVNNIIVKKELLDIISYQRPSAQVIQKIEQNIGAYPQKMMLVAKPDVANSLVGVISGGTVMFLFAAAVFFLSASTLASGNPTIFLTVFLYGLAYLLYLPVLHHTKSLPPLKRSGINFLVLIIMVLALKYVAGFLTLALTLLASPVALGALFAAFLLIFVPLTIWSVKVKSYIIEPYRIVAKSGIFYKKQVSVVFTKIDHINFSQKMLNKMFHNGNITVHTTGSSEPEIVVKNIHDYKGFYELLKKYY